MATRHTLQTGDLILSKTTGKAWNAPYALTLITAHTFVVAEDVATEFASGTFVVEGSTSNDGTYAIVSAVYTSVTTITVTETLTPEAAQGNLWHVSIPAAGDTLILDHACTTGGTALAVVSINTGTKTFTVSGNHAAEFASGELGLAADYDGVIQKSVRRRFTIVSATYSAGPGTTAIVVSETINVDTRLTLYVSHVKTLVCASLDCKGSGGGSLTFAGATKITGNVIGCEGITGGAESYGGILFVIGNLSSTLDAAWSFYKIVDVTGAAVLGGAGCTGGATLENGILYTTEGASLEVGSSHYCVYHASLYSDATLKTGVSNSSCAYESYVIGDIECDVGPYDCYGLNSSAFFVGTALIRASAQGTLVYNGKDGPIYTHAPDATHDHAGIVYGGGLIRLTRPPDDAAAVAAIATATAAKVPVSVSL
jgi:hypothetical protein